MFRQRSLLAAMLLFSVSLAADEPPPPRVELVVTVEREAIPREEAAAAVTVLGREQIESLPATSLAGLLAYVPGVTMMFDSGASGVPMITSRGFFGGGEVEYVKLLVDGVPAGDAESGNVDWRRFRAADIERIEVLHGPGSSLYGDTALGGVIQLFTRDSEPGGGELTLRGGSFGTREADACYVTDLGVYRLALRAGSAGNDGFRDHAGVEDRTLQLSLLRTSDRSRWRIDGSGSRKDRHEPGPLTRGEIGDDRAQSNPLFRFDRDETDRRRFAATYEAFGTTELLATVYAAQRDGDTLRTLLLAPGFGTTALRELTTRTYGTTLEAAREIAAGTVRAGMDLDRASLHGRYASVGDDGETLDVTASQRGRRDRLGLFVTGAWNVCARCRLSAGIRRDDLHDDFSGAGHDASAWSPRAGFTVRAGGASLFVQLSRAFKAPTLDQLFDPRPYPDGAGGTFTISNPSLRPQRARNVEAGVSRGGERFDYSLVAYRMNVTDEIDFDPQTYSYRNIGNSVHRGVEASVALAKTYWLSPRVTYAWTRVADAETPDRQLKNIPEHVAQLLLHARLPRATTLDLVYRWTDGMTLDDAGLFAMPSVSRVDLRAARDFARVRLHLDVLNALDARYNELGYVLFDFSSGQQAALEFPAPGRTLRAGATWRF
ncbi:MAG TPA: TonB-dependent receptor [Thermoanaerobaculia bacterium]|nr:TonB-dependent receptor [Thermoanaerobaculia bacterium]